MIAKTQMGRLLQHKPSRARQRCNVYRSKTTAIGKVRRTLDRQQRVENIKFGPGQVSSGQYNYGFGRARWT